MTKLEQLQTLDSDLLKNFLHTRKSSAISPILQDYIIKINAVPAILHFNGASVTKVIRELRKQFPVMSFGEARNIYYDAMSFFYIDDTVESEAWDNYYASQFDDLARLAIGLNKPNIAIKAFKEAHTLKTRNSDKIKPQDWATPIFIINNKVRPEDLGYEKQNVYDIARKAEDGYYLQMINNLPTSDKEKARLKKEAGIDVNYEEVDDAE